MKAWALPSLAGGRQQNDSNEPEEIVGKINKRIDHVFRQEEKEK